MATHMTRASRRRIDQLPLYLSVIIAQLVVAVVILSQVLFTTIYYWMSLMVETVAASTLGGGALLCLLAAASGTRYFRPTADIRDAYTVAAFAIVPVVLSMALFELGVIRSGIQLRGEIGLLLVLMTSVIVGLIGKAGDFHREIRRLSDELIRRVSIGVGED